MDPSAYLDRIGYAGPRAPDFATLDGVMRAHVAAVPFENLDVQLGRPVGLDLETIFTKIVGQRRGGWCYEQNGLLGWALAELGFEVRRIACGVMRAANGDAAMGNHLALIVRLDRPWLVDVGFGGSQAAPIALAEASHAHPPYAITLSRADADHWRFSETLGADKPFSFDFAETSADEALLAAKCAWLQTGAELPFVPNFVVQRRAGDRHLSLRGRVFSERGSEGETERLLADADDLVATLKDRFGLDVPEAATLWDRVAARHAALFPAT